MTGNEKYSEAELLEFQALVEGKLAKARQHYEQLQRQIQETNEDSDDDFGTDWIDDSNIHNQMEMLGEMAVRQRKYIHSLENALIRIRNKTYGICEVTGEKIDKRRLIAVPTTTKSLQAKTVLTDRIRLSSVREVDEEEEENEEKASSQGRQKPNSAGKVITRIIRKPLASPEKNGISQKGSDYSAWPEEDQADSDNAYFDPEDLADSGEEDFSFELDV
jgi:RNA polymerase-binding transcription factor DksA